MSDRWAVSPYDMDNLPAAGHVNAANFHTATPGDPVTFAQVWIQHMGGPERAARETLAAFDPLRPPLFDTALLPNIKPGESIAFTQEMMVAMAQLRASDPTHSDRLSRRLALRTLIEVRAAAEKTMLHDTVAALIVELGLQDIVAATTQDRVIAAAEGNRLANGQTLAQMTEGLSEQFGKSKSSIWDRRRDPVHQGNRDAHQRLRARAMDPEFQEHLRELPEQEDMGELDAETMEAIKQERVAALLAKNLAAEAAMGPMVEEFRSIAHHRSDPWFVREGSADGVALLISQRIRRGEFGRAVRWDLLNLLSGYDRRRIPLPVAARVAIDHALGLFDKHGRPMQNVPLAGVIERPAFMACARVEAQAGEQLTAEALLSTVANDRAVLPSVKRLREWRNMPLYQTAIREWAKPRP